MKGVRRKRQGVRRKRGEGWPSHVLLLTSHLFGRCPCARPKIQGENNISPLREEPAEGALFIFACLKKQGGGDAVRVVELGVFEDGEVDAKPPELQARARGEVTVPAPEAK